MTPFVFSDLTTVLPELVLAVMALLLLMLAVGGREENYRRVACGAVLSLLVAGGLVICYAGTGAVAFDGMFVRDGFSTYMKVLAIGGSTAALLMSAGYLRHEKIDRVEYPVLMLFSTLGMMLMISANDLISLYMGLELQSLPLYVLAAIHRDNVRSSEAGLKYFVLGALSSGLLLYGASLIYGFTGATGFEQIAAAFQGQETVSPGVVTGMVLVMAGLAFKISAVPFHMWAPDVYEGAPTSVTAFFAIAPKVAAIALMTRVLVGPFGGLAEQWQQVVILISMASMVLGAVAAVVQTNIKRLLAYSSIGHMGYALIGLAALNKAGLQGVIVYITLYVVMSAGTFCIVLMMKRKDKMVEKISDLSGLAKQRPMLALAMAVMMFSMAGIPPLAGFFGKLFIFQSAINAGLYTLAVVGVLTSVIAAYYYLRIIKVMYFDEAGEGIDASEDSGLNTVLLTASLAVVLFIVFPTPLLTHAEAAASSLIR